MKAGTTHYPRDANALPEDMQFLIELEQSARDEMTYTTRFCRMVVMPISTLLQRAIAVAP